jgi:hypothetical protein
MEYPQWLYYEAHDCADPSGKVRHWPVGVPAAQATMRV